MNARIIRFLFSTIIASVIPLLLLTLPIPAASAPQPVFHFEVAVTTTTDEYDTSGSGTGCSLREAIKVMNNGTDFGGCVFELATGPGPGRIFVPSGIYTLTIAGAAENSDATGDLDIASSMIMSATGAVTVTQSFGAPDRLFHIVSGNVTMRGLVIRGGVVTGGGGGVRLEPGTSLSLYDSELTGNNASTGAGISNSGGLTLTNVTLSGNTAGSGGGIFNDGGAVASLINVILASNSATNGSGIYNSGTANLTSVTLSDNHFGTSGGGIYNNSGTATLIIVTFSGNSALYGGGIYNEGGTVTLNNVTLSGNSSGGAGGTYGGGGIYNYSGTATLANVTLSGNSAFQTGGGIYNYSGTALLTNVTLSDNSATQGGSGGIRNDGTATLTNTIVANSVGGNCNTTISGSSNLSSDNTCGFGAGRDNVAAMLGPLANNGGATKTHALLPGSPAIDFGTDAGCPYTDQRGASRPIGAHCDVGAYEAGYLFLPLILK